MNSHLMLLEIDTVDALDKIQDIENFLDAKNPNKLIILTK